MLKRIRCTECDMMFYTAGDGRQCQTCSGNLPDTHAQAERDAEIIRQATARHETAEPQQVDPRTPARGKKGKSQKAANEETPDTTE